MPSLPPTHGRYDRAMPYFALCLVAAAHVLLHGGGDAAPSRWPIESSSSGAPGNAHAEPGGFRTGNGKRVSDAEIRKRIIAESIASYDGPCACPYQRARNGSRCGRRSAYDRPGGEAPLCYERDVTDEMVAAYRAEHGFD